MHRGGSVGTTTPSEGAGDAGSSGEDVTSKLVVVNGETGYDSLDDAFKNAEPDANGVITYKINGKADVSSPGWVQVLKSGLTNVNKVAFVGNGENAEICITQSVAILADQKYDIDVSFENLKLTKCNPTWAGDYANGTNYFTTWLRNTNQKNNTVTYTKCSFPNGVFNNQYGNTVFDDCEFCNQAEDLYNLWIGGGHTEVNRGNFTGARGVKVYSESDDVTSELKVVNATFTGLTTKAAFVVTKKANITLDSIDAKDCKYGFFEKNVEEIINNVKKSYSTPIKINGTGISGEFNVTLEKDASAGNSEFNITAGSFAEELSSGYLASGKKLSKGADGNYVVGEAEAVASVDGNKYFSLQKAIDAAEAGQTVALQSDVVENVTINKAITLDGQKHTITNTSECSTGNGFNKPTTHSINVTAPGATVQNLTFGDKADIASDAFEGSIAVKGCTFNATANGNVRTPIALNATDVTVSGNTFAGEDNAYYNPIELTQNKEMPLKKATVSGNLFTMPFKNNGISVYSYVDGAVIDVANNDFVFAGNGLRVSNYNDVAATFIVDGNSYAGTPTGDYAGFLLLQNTNKAKFSKLTFNITKMENNSGNNQLFYVYDDDGNKIVTNQNPVIVGDESIKDMTTYGGDFAVLAEVNGDYYSSLQAAVNAAEDGDTISLTVDTHGNGVVVPEGKFSKGLTIDFADHAYTVGGVLVGSASTASNAFQLRKGNSITMKNGSIFGDAAVAGDATTEWRGAPAIMIQNYSNLTLDHMKVVGGEETCYTLSNNNGDIVIKDSEITPGKAKGSTSYKPTAFDVCRYASYPSVNVTVEGASVINGDIEVGGTIGAGQSRQLTIKGGTFKGAFRKTDDPANISISAGTFVNEVPSDYIADGYECIQLGDSEYIVAKEGESKPSEGNASGSVSVSGSDIEVSKKDQAQIASSAAAAAGSLKNNEVSATADETKIGDVIIDTSNEAVKNDIAKVSEAANDLGASVAVKLVVKADTGTSANPKIEAEVQNTKTAVIPFALSVDMVTEVSKNGDVVKRAVVPVKETGSAITVTIKVDPELIRGKNVMVARVHDNAFETIEPKSVDYENGLVVFESAKFSDYAILASDPVQTYEVSAFKQGDDSAGWSHPDNPGYAFAGWYSDPDYRTPYTETSGNAYAKFVPISDLITFEGGSLRMDVVDPSKATYLRFGYHIAVPTGSRYLSNGWNYYTDYNTIPVYLAAYNNLAYENGTAMSNLVLADVPYTGYQIKTYSQMDLKYKTADGTTVQVTDSVRVRSVREVADMIVDNPIAPEDQVSLAQKIIAACDNNQ